jgi:hypothetical protein
MVLKAYRTDLKGSLNHIAVYRKRETASAFAISG